MLGHSAQLVWFSADRVKTVKYLTLCLFSVGIQSVLTFCRASYPAFGNASTSDAINPQAGRFVAAYFFLMLIRPVNHSPFQ